MEKNKDFYGRHIEAERVYLPIRGDPSIEEIKQERDKDHEKTKTALVKQIVDKNIITDIYKDDIYITT